MEHTTPDTPLIPPIPYEDKSSPVIPEIPSQAQGFAESGGFHKSANYRTLMCDIRNMRVLSESNRRALQYCDRTQLLEIIEIYNLIMQNIEYMFV